LAADEVDGSLLAMIGNQSWSRIRGVGFEHAVLAAAEEGGLAAVNTLVTFGGIVIEPGRNGAS